MAQKIKVLVSGSAGRMGSESVKAVSKDPELDLVGQVSYSSELNAAIKHSGAQVVIDFTHPDVAASNTKIILEAGARPVMGTTGFTAGDIADLQKLAKSKKLGGLIAPNFAIGAVLMMRFAAEAAKYFPRVEIVEKHHDAKADAPSGTAIKTAELISETIKKYGLEKQVVPRVNSVESLKGSLGGNLNNIHIHSIRLPGFIADQDVIFGSVGQRLTISHESLDRIAYMPGVILACKKVMTLNELVYGLEHLL
jgi:4-hydroxy-tetrahydrodipicolinate reductase